MSQPTFSVLIPSYNRPEFIRAAVESVLASGYADLEVLVSDDCSPRQNEIEAVLAPCLSDRRVRMFFQARNLREPGNRQFLLDHAMGRWVVFLGDDDLLSPDAFIELEQAIPREPQAQIFTFGYSLIDESGRSLYSRRAPKPLRIHLDAEPFILREFLVSSVFPFWLYHPATFCCDVRLRQSIASNVNIGIGDDLQYLFDCVNAGYTIQVLPRILMSYRKMTGRAGSVQPNQSTVPFANVETRYRILRWMESRADLKPQIQAVICSASFRRRFLYDVMAIECDDVVQAAERLQMDEPHRAELLRFRQSPRTLRKFSGYLRRSCDFARLFGASAFPETARVASQRAQTQLLGPRH